MTYNGMELLWLFFVYSFLGWVIETAAAGVSQKKLVNRGYFSSPFCFAYGTAAVMMTSFFWELTDQWFFLFLGCAALGTAVEWVIGKALERMNHRRWWDYSKKKFNFDGYICLQYSILWGILGLVAVKYANGFFNMVFHLIPDPVRSILLFVLLGIAALDLIASTAAVFHISKGMGKVRQWNSRIMSVTSKMAGAIVSCVEHRLLKAYPVLLEKADKAAGEGKFAEGCSFYKLFLLFFIGALLGDLVETVFCRFSMGWWMSRSSLVWGPFSIVWGIAIALATILLYKDREKPDAHIFIVGTVMGGVYEYLCSVFTELVFGKIFWDYSKIPFNLGGRINLLFCFFWGIAAVVWIKLLYPRISSLIEKIPKVPGVIVTWILVIFMVCNMVVSSAALIRYDAREKGIEPRNSIEQLLDERFPDERMERIYPNAKSR